MKKKKQKFYQKYYKNILLFFVGLIILLYLGWGASPMNPLYFFDRSGEKIYESFISDEENLIYYHTQLANERLVEMGVVYDRENHIETLKDAYLMHMDSILEEYKNLLEEEKKVEAFRQFSTLNDSVLPTFVRKISAIKKKIDRGVADEDLKKTLKSDINEILRETDQLGIVLIREGSNGLEEVEGFRRRALRIVLREVKVIQEDIDFYQESISLIRESLTQEELDSMSFHLNNALQVFTSTRNEILTNEIGVTLNEFEKVRESLSLLSDELVEYTRKQTEQKKT